MKKYLLTFLTLLSLAEIAYSQKEERLKENTDLISVEANVIIKMCEKQYFENNLFTKNNLVLTKIDRINDKAKTITIELYYDKSLGTVLRITNPFSNALVYKAALYSKIKNAYLEPNDFSVNPKIGSKVKWKVKTDKIRLTGFKLED